MGLDYLLRVRRTSLLLGGAMALCFGSYASLAAGAAFAAGVGWTLVNLYLIERLVGALMGPDRGTKAAVRRAGMSLGGMLLLFAAGAGLLRALPVPSLIYGSLVPYVVLFLKAASTSLLESRAWKKITASSWRSALLVLFALMVAWWWVPAWLPPGAPAAAQEQHAAPDSHAASDPREGAAAGTGHAASGTGPAAHGAAQASGPQKFPNVITLIVAAFPDAEWAHALHRYEAVIFSMFVGLLVCGAGFFASRRPQMIPGPLQNGAEMLVEGLYNFVGGILGPRHGARFFPLIGALFVYIFAMNLFGVLPLMDSPTSNLNVTFALGLTVFVYVQYVGIRSLGVVGYFDHMLGSPRNLTGWVLAPLLFPIHLLGELAKPISLSCRLFGNIFGEDMLMVGFASLGISMLSFTHWPIGVPMHAIFFPLALLTSGLQAFVFTVLTTIYILLMLPHEAHGHGEEAQHAH